MYFCMCMLGILQALWQAYTCEAEVTTCPSATPVVWLWAHYALQILQKPPVFPVSSSAITPPVPARSAGACRGHAGRPAGELLLTSAWVYNVCLPFSLATLSFTPGSWLGKGILRNASATFWHRQGPGAFSYHPKVRHLRKLKTHSGSRVSMPLTWAETRLPRCWEKSPEHGSNNW